MSGVWRPIETAPRDGTPILACVAGTGYFPDKVQWSGAAWAYPCGEHGPSLPLTHWQPLPFAPGPPSADLPTRDETHPKEQRS